MSMAVLGRFNYIQYLETQSDPKNEELCDLPVSEFNPAIIVLKIECSHSNYDVT